MERHLRHKFALEFQLSRGLKFISVDFFPDTVTAKAIAIIYRQKYTEKNAWLDVKAQAQKWKALENQPVHFPFPEVSLGGKPKQ